MKKPVVLLLALSVLLPLSCSGNKDDAVDYTEGVNCFEDLGGRSVALISGSLHDLTASQLKPTPQLLRLASSAEVLAALASKQADYIIEDSILAIGTHMEERGFKQAFVSDAVSGPYGFGFSHQDELLHAQFNAFMARYRAEGKLAEMVERWTKGDVESVIMPDIPLNPGAPVLRVGTTNLFPFTFIQNGRPAGLEIELLQNFAAEIGCRLEVQNFDFSGLIAALASGKVDIINSAITITEERSKQVLFSDSYYYCRTVCYCRDNASTKSKSSFLIRQKDKFKNNLIYENRWKLVVNGLWGTLIISILSILFGTVLGGIICWMKLSKYRILRKIATVYVDIIRGVPILVLLMLMFYVVFATGGVSARWVAIIAFAMNFGGYASEMFRTGIESVDKGQTEAGLAMGFTQLQTFFLFVVPQSLKHILPVFKGEAISLVKNTSVVGFIAIQDLTKASEIIRARTFDAFYPLLIVSAIYFFLAWLLGKGLDALAKKMK